MRWSASARRFVASIAAFALLLAALVPMGAHALAGAHGAPGLAAVVCTADGVRIVADSAPAAPKAKLLDHCPFCVSHGGAVASPPAPVGAAIVAGADAVPRAFLRAPRSLSALSTAQPRAPPSIS